MIHIANSCSKKSVFKYKLGAVIVKSGNVVAIGFNRVGHRAKGINDPLLSTSIHAERAAISRLLKPKHFHKLIGAKIYVSRVAKDGSTRLAYPCKKCMELIKSSGIKEIVYTTNEGTINREKI